MWLSKLLQRSDNKFVELYLKECGHIREHYPDQYDRTFLMKMFPKWYRSQISGKTPLDERRPWLTERAIRYLDGIIEPGMNVLEYGCGGSTLFFLDRGCHVTSVEHNRKWVQAVEQTLDKEQIKQWEPLVVEKKDDNIDKLEQAYRQMPLTPEASYDVILIDGLAREQCLSAVRKTEFSGWLIYDNSDRFADTDKLRSLSKSTFKQFAGPTCYSMPFTETTILDV